MAQAFKCDRCGKLFEAEDDIDGHVIYDSVLPEQEYGVVTTSDGPRYNTNQLCYECAEKLEKFMEGRNLIPEFNSITTDTRTVNASFKLKPPGEHYNKFSATLGDTTNEIPEFMESEHSRNY